jgi:hypothetical protein
MSERASQFFFTMLGFHLSLFDILFFGKTRLGREFVTVHFAPLGNDVCYRFWLKLLGLQPAGLFI